MVWWKEYALSVIGRALLCGIIIHAVSSLRYSRLIRLVCGTVLAITVLKPLSSVQIGDSLKFDTDGLSPDTYVDLGKEKAEDKRKQCITDTCASYIFSKANELGMCVTAEVFLDEALIPDRVQINCQSGLERRKDLEEYMEEVLGITKEKQVWIWNQEKGS